MKRREATIRGPVTVISLFLSLTTVFYFLGVWLIYRIGSATPLMLSVGLATLVTCLATRTSVASLGWHWGGWRVQWLSYLLPLAYALLAYAIIWALDLGRWYDLAFVQEQTEAYNLAGWSNASVIGLHFLLTATISFCLVLPSVLGEEIGWRGLLVPQLSKLMPFGGVALVSGLIWSVWHWPLMIMGIYGAADPTPFFFQLGCFTAVIVSMSVVMTYLRFRTDSLWPAVVFHMSHNVFLQKFFSPLTEAGPGSAWFLDEFGLVLPGVLIPLATYFWLKGRSEFLGGKD